MDFSIVIPLYNKVRYVSETIASVMQQEKLPKELIVIDDCSTDGSLEKVKETLKNSPKRFESVHVEIIELSENHGPGYARNLGMQKATGDFISFLDADDLYHTSLLSKVETLSTQYHMDFIVVGIHQFPSGTQRPKLNRIYKNLSLVTPDAYILDTPFKTITHPDFVMGTGSNVFVKKKWLQNTRYVEDSLFNEANDFWYRVLKNVLAYSNTEIGLLTGNFLKVREVAGSLSRKKYARWNEIEIPPIYKRYHNSSYKYDRFLVGVICGRWIKHAFRNLQSFSQKLTFVYEHRKLFWNQFTYYVLRWTS